MVDLGQKLLQGSTGGGFLEKSPLAISFTFFHLLFTMYWEKKVSLNIFDKTWVLVI